MRIRYDALGDILYVDFVEQSVDQRTDMIDGITVARSNPSSGKVESLEILTFLQALREGDIELPVDEDLVPRWDVIGRPNDRAAR